MFYSRASSATQEKEIAIPNQQAPRVKLAWIQFVIGKLLIAAILYAFATLVHPSIVENVKAMRFGNLMYVNTCNFYY